MTTSEELRTFMTPLSDNELHAAITIAETILAGRERDRGDGLTICRPFLEDER